MEARVSVAILLRSPEGCSAPEAPETPEAPNPNPNPDLNPNTKQLRAQGALQSDSGSDGIPIEEQEEGPVPAACSCIEVFKPVCARTKDGLTNTYPNSCHASCEEATVISEGPC
ncbi:hypothetical protein DUNSADRAFT_13289 [Dunaliella salina]|uniref:Kazal-like domain-containing protein n=1 Tax=Dunaliella salina TaxID=3046 RepID=A0ABQ7G9R8_DUNSA|nr:hypothetical protein DUNSADRAFT_13289 [Dunaliella salina]|eukprot:KAF5831350.1 hypothetical protein DUNSADRAFT_13289 [Dunaliella salina]